MLFDRSYNPTWIELWIEVPKCVEICDYHVPRHRETKICRAAISQDHDLRLPKNNTHKSRGVGQENTEEKKTQKIVKSFRFEICEQNVFNALQDTFLTLQYRRIFEWSSSGSWTLSLSTPAYLPFIREDNVDIVGPGCVHSPIRWFIPKFVSSKTPTYV